MSSPWEQEVPYGTRKTFNGIECVYMPDPWTFPEGYGNAWCSIPALERTGKSYPKEVYN